MLKSLTLERFGKFLRITFDLAPVTVFFGDNEAGKTTIFDALFDALAAPGAGISAGKELRRRYGDDRRVEARFEGEKPRIDPGEFLNLYALRAGDLKVEFKDGEEWMDRVKARLFSGGIDPNQIRVELEKRASTKGSTKASKELKALESEKSEAGKRLADLQEKRRQILAEEKRDEGLRGSTAAMETKIRSLNDEVEKLKTEVEQEEKISRRRRMDRTLELLEEGESLRRELGSLAGFETDRTEELDGLTKRIGELRGDKRALDSGIAGARTERTKADQQVQEVEGLRERAKARAEAAGGLTDRITTFQEQPPLAKRVSWNRGLLVTAAAVPAGSVAAAFMLSESASLRWVLIFAGAVAGALILLLSRKTDLAPDEEARRRFLSGLLDGWRNAFPDEEPVRRETIEGFQEFLIAQRTTFQELEKRREKARAGLVEATEELARKDQDLAKTTRDLEELEASEKQWLHARKVATRDEYAASVSRFKLTDARSKNWKEKLAGRLSEAGLKTAEELRRECDRSLRTMDEEGIPRQGRLEAEVVRLRTLYTQKQKEHASLVENHTRKLGELKEKEGIIKGSLGDLPERLLQEEERIRLAAQKIGECAFERQAAQLASEIFGELAKDARAGLEELGSDLAAQVSRVVAGAREVKVLELKPDSISLADAGGEVRPLNLLSSGTRDAFLFAARLALARRAADGGDRILVLDEPFLALDPRRRRSALELLESFQAETGWQVVVLTKERELVTELKSVFPAEKIREVVLEVDS
jgi:recombinational DNA repair ATPase RecF